jgi:hypothetical protein
MRALPEPRWRCRKRRQERRNRGALNLAGEATASALVKLSRPGVFEIEPTRWQVLDATHTQSGGLIDSGNVLIGGSASTLGSQLTAETLGKFMGNISGVNYAAWISPLKNAMAEFNITTPQRIAAFFAQIRAESG